MPKAKVKPSFETAIQTLESIVKQLEEGDLPLDKSLELYEQGIKLANQCQKTLSQAEQKVSILTSLEKEAELKPFESEFDNE